ncbi:WXG100-like domain-containing protein [Thermomonospora cellulosilytica]|uniref:Uncharacterized protein YukE n=1 Tax=Thermomonospora cellulosilytica TaxID=1411118 RepID=A0A7W3R663_9ACTN|nr:hypothetical protein [Thermomonospora cellulosilytica]MBA9001813.1 uncharacterized protein YukE [Thermomonospora cellulosilytica]
MGLEIPDEVKWLSWIVGMDWPEGDETAMRRAAQAWHDGAKEIGDLIGDLQASATQVLGTVEGQAADEFERYWQQFVSTDPQVLVKLQQGFDALGKALEDGALEIEYAKYMFIALLIITAIEIAMLIAAAVATFGASTAAIPAVQAGAQITARMIAQRLLQALMQRLGQRLGGAILRGALFGVLEGVGLDLAVQGLQIAQGNRDGIDGKKTLQAGIDGAIGGALSGGLSHGAGKIPGLGDVADGSPLGNALRGAVREGGSEALAGVGGTVVSAAMSGESLSAEDLAKGATSGAFGGAVGGAKGGLDVQAPTLPGGPDFGGGGDGGNNSSGGGDGGDGGEGGSSNGPGDPGGGSGSQTGGGSGGSGGSSSGGGDSGGSGAGAGAGAGGGGGGTSGGGGSQGGGGASPLGGSSGGDGGTQSGGSPSNGGSGNSSSGNDGSGGSPAGGGASPLSSPLGGGPGGDGGTQSGGSPSNGGSPAGGDSTPGGGSSVGGGSPTGTTMAGGDPGGPSNSGSQGGTPPGGSSDPSSNRVHLLNTDFSQPGGGSTAQGGLGGDPSGGGDRSTGSPSSTPAGDGGGTRTGDTGTGAGSPSRPAGDAPAGGGQTTGGGAPIGGGPMPGGQAGRGGGTTLADADSPQGTPSGPGSAASPAPAPSAGANPAGTPPMSGGAIPPGGAMPGAAPGGMPAGAAPRGGNPAPGTSQPHVPPPRPAGDAHRPPAPSGTPRTDAPGRTPPPTGNPAPRGAATPTGADGSRRPATPGQDGRPTGDAPPRSPLPTPTPTPATGTPGQPRPATADPAQTAGPRTGDPAQTTPSRTDNDAPPFRHDAPEGARARGGSDGPPPPGGDGPTPPPGDGDGSPRPPHQQADWNPTHTNEDSRDLDPDQRIADQQDLDPNTRYEVYEVDADGGRTLRSIAYTDDTGRVTHISTPDRDTPDAEDTVHPDDNIDLYSPEPGVVHRVDLGIGEPHVFTGQRDGAAPAGTTFDPPDTSGPVDQAAGAPEGRYETDSEPSDPARPNQRVVRDYDVDADGPFSARDDLRPNTRYEVRSGDRLHGVFWTNENGQVTHVRTWYGNRRDGFNPELGDRPRTVAEHNVPRPNAHYMAEPRDRFQRQADADLEPPAAVRTGEFTQGGVDPGTFLFHTDDRGQTDSAAGQPDYGSHPSQRNDRGDGSAQAVAGQLGDIEYGEKFNGGHIFAHEARGPGEWINYFPQWDETNQGHYADDVTFASSWRGMEYHLQQLQRNNPDITIARFDFFAEPNHPQFTPEVVHARWVEVDSSTDPPQVRTRYRSFHNLDLEQRANGPWPDGGSTPPPGSGTPPSAGDSGTGTPPASGDGGPQRPDQPGSTPDGDAQHRGRDGDGGPQPEGDGRQADGGDRQEQNEQDRQPGQEQAGPVPDGLPPHLHDVWRGSEETPAGRSLFDPSEQNMRDLAQRVPADPNRFVLDGHGDANGMRVGDRRLSVDEVADLIRNDPNWNGREVLLLSCNTGEGDFARQLAERLGVPVTAPTTQAWTDRQGRVFAATSEPGPDGRPEPTWPPNGAWNTHNPDGTTTRSGENGFPGDSATPAGRPSPDTGMRGDPTDPPPGDSGTSRPDGDGRPGDDPRTGGTRPATGREGTTGPEGSPRTPAPGTPTPMPSTGTSQDGGTRPPGSPTTDGAPTRPGSPAPGTPGTTPPRTTDLATGGPRTSTGPETPGSPADRGPGRTDQTPPRPPADLASSPTRPTDAAQPHASDVPSPTDDGTSSRHGNAPEGALARGSSGPARSRFETDQRRRAANPQLYDEMKRALENSDLTGYHVCVLSDGSVIYARTRVIDPSSGQERPEIHWDAQRRAIVEGPAPMERARYYGGREWQRREATPENRERHQPLVGRRRQIIDEARRLEGLYGGKDKNPTPEQAAELQRAQHARTTAGEDLGEAAARDAIHDLLPGAVPDPRHPTDLPDGQKSGYFDQVYRAVDPVTGKPRFILLEAKGPSVGGDSDPTGRKNPVTDIKYEQGRREYFELILEQMRDRGPEEAALADELEDALDDGRLEYHIVRAKTRMEDGQEVYDGYEHRQYDLREPPEDPTTATGQDSGDEPGANDTSQPLPEGLPPRLEEVWRNSEQTPAGRSFFDRGEQGMRDLAQRVPADPQRFVLDAHGDAGGIRVGGRRLSVDEVADLIRHDPNWNGREVLLLSCNTGEGDFARRLAERLGVPVTAPTTPAWTDRQGRIFATDATPGPDGEPEPTWPPSGSWNTHNPDGTTTPSGQGGFPQYAGSGDADASTSSDRQGDPPPDPGTAAARGPDQSAAPEPEPGPQERRASDELMQRIADDPRVQRMLDTAGEPLASQLRNELRDTLPARPDLARVIEGNGPPPLSPVESALRESLLSRPKTLHSLLSHPEAIPVLERAVAEVDRLGADAILNGDGPVAQPTPLTDEQRAASQALADSIAAGRRPGEDPSPRVAPDQPGFDPSQVADRTDRDDPYINRYLDGLYQGMRESVPVLRDLVNDPAIREAGGDPHLRPGEKDRVRALDKIIGDYQGNASRLNDLLGAKIQFSSVDGLYRALGDIRQIAARHGVEIVSVKDRMQNPQASGYRDVQMTVRMPGGHIGELRLHLTQIDRVASYEHALYEVRRDLPMAAADQNRPLTPEEEALDRAINQQVITRFADALTEALDPPATPPDDPAPRGTPASGTTLADGGPAPTPSDPGTSPGREPAPQSSPPAQEPSGPHQAGADPDRRPGEGDPAPHGRVPEGLPPHLHDVWRGSEETPAGRSLFDPSEQGMRDLAQRVPADPQRFVLDGHGDADGMRMGDRRLSVDDVADLIRNDPNWNGREVLLISCNTGEGDFARQLAERLGVPVTAPTTQAWTDRQGRVFAATSEPGPDGKPQPTWPPDGTWNTHHPDGTTTPSGRDGHPGTERSPAGEPPESAEARGRRRPSDEENDDLGTPERTPATDSDGDFGTDPSIDVNDPGDSSGPDAGAEPDPEVPQQVDNVPPPRTDGPTYPTKDMEEKWKYEYRPPPNPVWRNRAVFYLNEVQRERLRIWVDDEGLIRDAKGRLFDTTQGETIVGGGAQGRAIFVMDKFGNLYASNIQAAGVFHHSSFLAGGPVASAGELRVVNGRLELISDRSGHYLPPPEFQDRVVEMLRQAGVTITDDMIKSWDDE